jgi:hypothetical protein
MGSLVVFKLRFILTRSFCHVTKLELSVTPAAARQREFSLLNDIDTLQNKLFELDSQKKRTELLIHRFVARFARQC